MKFFLITLLLAVGFSMLSRRAAAQDDDDDDEGRHAARGKERKISSQKFL